MERKSQTTLLTALALPIIALSTTSAFAHPMHSHHSSFSDGLAHGLTSWNHLLVALTVGFLCRIALTNYPFGWGKALIATTAIYTVTHLSQIFSSGWTAPGLILGFLSVGLIGAAFGHVYKEQAIIKRFRLAGTTCALAVLLFTW